MATFKLHWAPDSPDAMGDFIVDTFGPMWEKFVDQTQEKTGITHIVDMEAFVNVWANKAMALVLAYEDGEACGFAPMFVFSPIFTQVKAAQVELWWADTPEVEEAMFEYIRATCGVLGVDQLHVAQVPHRPLPAGVPVDRKDSYQMLRVELS